MLVADQSCLPLGQARVEGGSYFSGKVVFGSPAKPALRYMQEP